MRLVIVRHGQTDLNLQRRIQGQSDVPLNSAGRAQAQALATQLAGFTFSAVYCSDLVRAVETAQILAAPLGVPVQVDARLTERAFGQFEGLTDAELRARFPQAFKSWRETGDAPEVGLELRAAAGKRFAACVAEIRSAFPEGVAASSAIASERASSPTVLLVSHGSTITQGVITLLGLDPAVWAGLGGLDNCHWALLETTVRRPGWRLVEYNLGV